MNTTRPEDRDENRHLRQAVAETMALLGTAAKRLHEIMQEEAIMAETPLEAQDAMESAAEAIGASSGSPSPAKVSGMNP